MRGTSTRFGARVSQLFKAGVASLLVMGIPMAVLCVTIASIILSVLVCGLAIYLTMPEMPFNEWFYYTAITPAIVSPLVSLAVFSLAYDLAEAHRQLAQAAATDPLTGIGNRRRFYEHADRDIARSRADNFPTALLILDIDHFKRLNDSYGHETGDEALIAVARTCAANLRQTDLICRWGGEEFIVLLPGCHLRDALRIGEMLRQAVSAMRMEPVKDSITISVGAAEIDRDTTLRDAIARADTELYRAKDAGRNQVQPQLSP